MKNAIIYTVLLAALQVVVSAVAQLVWNQLLGNSGVMGTEFMIGTLIVFNVLGLILFLATKWAVVSRAWIRTRPWLVLFWAAMASVGCIVPSMWLQEVMPELPNLMQDGLEELMGNRLGYVVVGLLAPLVEEVVFRGAILRALLKWNQNHWLGIAISAALFGLSHFNPAQMPHAFLAGLLLGWMYYRTGSILPGVVVHWVNNSMAYALYNISKAAYGTGDPTMAQLFGEQRVLLAILFSLCILIPAIYQLNLRMKRA
jgi:membrane protease YdiL (CAAX protease family)